MAEANILPIELGERFQAAFELAFQLHRGQKRKGSQVAYISHLMATAALVIEMNGSENEAIAALLHDAVEDQGGYETLERIRARFGDDVAGMVHECSDAFVSPKPPWKERKIHYLAHLPEASAGAQRISLADKIHNARDLLNTYAPCGEETWERFRGGREGTLWYYRSLVTTYQGCGGGPWVDELARIVGLLEQFSQLQTGPA